MFFDMIRPSFAAEASEKDIMALLKRAHCILFTKRVCTRGLQSQTKEVQSVAHLWLTHLTQNQTFCLRKEVTDMKHSAMATKTSQNISKLT